MKPLKYIKRNLRLQLSVRKQLVGLDTKLISDILNWTRLHRSVNLNICHRSSNGMMITALVGRQYSIGVESIRWALLDRRGEFSAASP